MNAIDVNVSKVIETIGHCCMLHVPLKSFKSFKVTHFHIERKILMRKRRKLMKKTIHDSKISEKLISIDKKICASIKMKSFMMNKWQLLKLKMIHISFLDMQKSQVFVGQISAQLLIVSPMINF